MRPIPFRPFIRNAETNVYLTGNLPHWRQSECTYFVTFCTSDSLPRVILEALHRDFRGFQQSDSESTEDTWHKKLDNYLDRGSGRCLLRDSRFRDLTESSIRHFDSTRLHLGDFVIMPNHVHALITPLEGERLEDLLASIKRFSGRQINEATGNKGSFWQRNSYDRIVRSAPELERFQRYIRDNPDRVGLKDGEFTVGTAEYEFHDAE